MEHQGSFVLSRIPKYYIKVFSHYFCIYLFSQLSPKESFKNAWENCRFEYYLCILTEYLRDDAFQTWYLKFRVKSFPFAMRKRRHEALIAYILHSWSMLLSVYYVQFRRTSLFGILS